MDEQDVDKTKEIENKEDVHESNIRNETQTEIIDNGIISKNLENAEATEHSFDFKKLESIEKNLVDEIKKVKDHMLGFSKENVSIEDFKTSIRNLVLSLEIVENHRVSIKGFVNNVVSREKELLDSTEKKLKEERAELDAKKIEDRIREHMYDKGPGYDKGAHKVEMAEVEEIHEKQLVALDKEKEELNKMLSECSTERKQAKLVHLEMKNIIRCNEREEKDMNEIAQIITHHNLLEVLELPEPKILDQLKALLDDLVKTVAVEIHLMDSLPSQLVDLNKEEHLDQEMMSFVSELEKDSDIRHKYVI
jgi:predicted GIY-YIG superfamily endonuclease